MSVLTWKYIAQFLSKEKMLKASEVGAIVELPKAKGLLVESPFVELKNEKDFNQYFPDDPERRAIPRAFIFNVGSEGDESLDPQEVRRDRFRAQQASRVAGAGG